MRFFKHLDRGLLFLVLIMGLGGCSLSETSENQAAKRAWGLPEPVYLRGDGEKVAFQKLGLTSQSLSFGDQLYFPSLNPEVPGVRLSIESRCFLNSQEYGPHQMSLTMKNQFYIYEFLPPSILLLPDHQTQKPLCRIDFVAINSEGSTHQFSIDQVSVNEGAFVPTLHLLTTESTERIDNTLIFSQMDLHKASLRPEHPLTRYVQALCADRETHLILYQFSLTLLDLLKDSRLNIENPKDHCRLVGFNSSKKIIELGDRFFVRKSISAPATQLSMSWQYDKNTKLLNSIRTRKGTLLTTQLGTITFYNTSDRALNLRLYSGDNHELQGAILLSSTSPYRVFSTEHKVSLSWKKSLKPSVLKTTPDGKYSLLSIFPKSSINMDLYASALYRKCKSMSPMGLQIVSTGEQNISLYDIVEAQNNEITPTAQGTKLDSFILIHTLAASKWPIPNITSAEPHLCN